MQNYQNISIAIISDRDTTLRRNEIKMKTFFTLASIFLVMTVAVVNADLAELSEKFHKMVEECSEELGVEHDILLKALKQEEGVDKKQVGCMEACLLKKSGAMIDGKINIDKLPPMFSKLREISEECIRKTQDIEDECEKSSAFVKCLHTIRYM